jgi:hypothetical protein
MTTLAPSCWERKMEIILTILNQTMTHRGHFHCYRLHCYRLHRGRLLHRRLSASTDPRTPARRAWYSG